MPFRVILSRICVHLPLCKARRADYLFHCKAPRAFSQDVFTDSARKTLTFALRYDYNDICPSNAGNAAAEGKALFHNVQTHVSCAAQSRLWPHFVYAAPQNAKAQHKPRKIQYRGVAQLVARLVWDQDVAGSIPVTPTTSKQPRMASLLRCKGSRHVGLFLFFAKGSLGSPCSVAAHQRCAHVLTTPPCRYHLFAVAPAGTVIYSVQSTQSGVLIGF